MYLVTNFGILTVRMDTQTEDFHKSPTLAYRYWHYLQERFPLYQFVPLCLLLTATLDAGWARYAGTPFSPKSVLAASAALFLFLLRLRIFDEHKDAQHDQEFHPKRPVPRGLVTLKELRWLLAVVLLLEFLMALYGGNILLFGIALAYSLLMLKEFFCGTWLRSHFTVYIASHELLLLPLLWYVMNFLGAHLADVPHPQPWWLLLFVGMQLFLLEVARKIKAPVEESGARDTYTSQYGVVGTAMLLSAISILLFIAGSFFHPWLGAETLWFVEIVVLAGTSASFVHFAFSKNVAAARSVFLAAVVYVALSDILFIFLLAPWRG